MIRADGAIEAIVCLLSIMNNKTHICKRINTYGTTETTITCIDGISSSQSRDETTVVYKALRQATYAQLNRSLTGQNCQEV